MERCRSVRSHGCPLEACGQTWRRVRLSWRVWRLRESCAALPLGAHSHSCATDPPPRKRLSRYIRYIRVYIEYTVLPDRRDPTPESQRRATPHAPLSESTGRRRWADGSSRPPPRQLVGRRASAHYGALSPQFVSTSPARVRRQSAESESNGRPAHPSHSRHPVS